MNQVFAKTNHQDLCFSIWEGTEALSQIQVQSFLADWRNLLQLSDSPSIFQAPDFVLPWYKENLLEFSPLILAAFSRDRLVGLITLARKVQNPNGVLCKRLVGAGNFYSLYQTWLVEKQFFRQFLELGIKKILDRIPGCVINLKSIPSAELLKQLDELPVFRKQTVSEKFHNPILDFTEDGYDKVFSKRHFKSKINRLNRGGEVVFEKIDSADRLLSVFPMVETYYALRQGAAFNKIPFSSQNDGLRLFQAWLASGVLHMTCLWLNGNLIGAIIMIDDFGKTAHLAGLITYSPMHAKFSPGLVHLYRLALMLKEENYANMKLSPGYDAYKDRFSNKGEEVYELMISGDAFQLIKRRLRVRLRSLLLQRGIRPMELEVEWSKLKSKFKNWPSRLWERISPSRVPLSGHLEKIEAFMKRGAPFEKSLRKDILTDLLLADDDTFDVARWEFLEDALRRLEEGEHFVTWLKENTLLACIWYTGDPVESQEDLFQREQQQSICKVYRSSKM